MLHLRWRKIELVQNHPVAVADGLHKHSFLKDKLAVWVGDISAHVLLQVRVLVVIDAHTAMTRECSKVRDHGRLPTGRGACERGEYK